MTADQLWTPATSPGFWTRYYKKNTGSADFTRLLYPWRKGKQNERMEDYQLGIDQFKPQVHYRAISNIL